MADMSKLKVEGTTYNLKDSSAYHVNRLTMSSNIPMSPGSNSAYYVGSKANAYWTGRTDKTTHPIEICDSNGTPVYGIPTGSTSNAVLLCQDCSISVTQAGVYSVSGDTRNVVKQLTGDISWTESNSFNSGVVTIAQLREEFRPRIYVVTTCERDDGNGGRRGLCRVTISTDGKIGIAAEEGTYNSSFTNYKRVRLHATWI